MLVGEMACGLGQPSKNWAHVYHGGARWRIIIDTTIIKNDEISQCLKFSLN